MILNAQTALGIVNVLMPLIYGVLGIRSLQGIYPGPWPKGVRPAGGNRLPEEPRASWIFSMQQRDGIPDAGTFWMFSKAFCILFFERRDFAPDVTQ